MNTRRISPTLTFAAVLCAAPVLACVEGPLRGEAVTLEREVGATQPGETASMNILGMGYFHAVEIVKHGGMSDATSVTLELDGQPLITTSFATLKNKWNQLNNRSIVADVRTEGDTETMTIWYSPELPFRTFVSLRVEVQEEGVDSLQMRTVMNKPAPHEHPAGQLTLALPAFK
jgi:hypothetical protein